MLEVDALPGVPPRERRQVRLETRPVESFHLLLDRRRVGMLRLGIDFGLGIQREEHEAGSHGGVDVLELFQMIRVATDRLRPARLEGTPGRVVEHVARGSPAAPHLPDGLLGEDGADCCADCIQRSHVAGCRQPEPVAEAGRGVQSEAGRVQPGQRRPQRQGVVRRRLGDETSRSIDRLCRPRETAEGGLILGHGHQPLDPSIDRSSQ